MELERNVNNKLSNLSPSSIKENNMNLCNLFGSNLKNKKKSIDDFKLATKLKRNFK